MGVAPLTDEQRAMVSDAFSFYACRDNEVSASIAALIVARAEHAFETERFMQARAGMDAANCNLADCEEDVLFHVMQRDGMRDAFLRTLVQQGVSEEQAIAEGFSVWAREEDDESGHSNSMTRA